MYSILVLEFGLNPHQVLDDMSMFEIRPLIDRSYMVNKDRWEQARLIAFVTAQSQSTKRIKMDDFMKFPWEEEIEHEPKSIDWDEVKRMQDEIKNREKNLNNNGK